jgi:Dynein heavy chain C-terminal domain
MQEAERCNTVLTLISEDLHELRSGLRGELTMSAELDKLLQVDYCRGVIVVQEVCSCQL